MVEPTSTGRHLKLEKQMRTQAWIVQWWDSRGQAHSTPPMDRDEAESTLASMDIRQEAQMVLVYINQ